MRYAMLTLVATTLALAQPAIHEAVFYEDKAKLMALIASGVNVNSENDAGLTPLHVAIKKRDLDLARVLIEAGADIDAQDNRGNTALILAVKKKISTWSPLSSSTVRMSTLLMTTPSPRCIRLLSPGARRSSSSCSRSGPIRL